MWKLVCCSVLLYKLIKTANGNPIWANSVPFWDNPCGGIMEVYAVSNIEDLKEVHVRSVRKLRQQLKLSQLQLMHYNFDNLLVDAQRGVERENYIPNWIPDINSVLPVIENGIQTLSSYPDQLTGMHTDLQKFAIAFEQVWKDENDSTRKDAMTSLIEYLREVRKPLIVLIAPVYCNTEQSVLCEVESTIISLGESIPTVLPRSLMTPAERASLTYTNRIIRDNGILLKYREFINAWITVFKNARFSSEQLQNRRKRKILF